jgi:hypothetical protein
MAAITSAKAAGRDAAAQPNLQLTTRSFFFLILRLNDVLGRDAIMAVVEGCRVVGAKELAMVESWIDAVGRMLKPGTTVGDGVMSDVADDTIGRLTLFKVGSLTVEVFRWSNVAWLSRGWPGDCEEAAIVG